MKTIGYFLGMLCLFCSLANAGAVTVDHHGKQIPVDMNAEGCLACHDGATAKVISYCTVMCDFSTAHAIFKPYPPRKNAQDFAPASAVVAQGVKLQNGQVSCISCHDMRNPADSHLLKKNDRTNICIICHIRK